ncbi:hypothetical protein [Hyalangium versicolor]|uniref:hypothetical protein n=1 Tax=Hyalangium versicolor TaxID=2861190 RepID=UPI001CCD570D|nr:hypothetical protein [Hyalangium versicolor]
MSSVDTARLHALLEELLPIQSDFFGLHWVPDATDRPNDAAEGDLCAVFRLVCWDMGGADPYIHYVFEQAVLLVPAAHREDPRIEAWLRGWSEALTSAMQSQDWTVGRNDEEARHADNAMAKQIPSRLVHPDVLKLSRPQTAEDFTRALLDSKSRLGGLVFPPPKP